MTIAGELTYPNVGESTPTTTNPRESHQRQPIQTDPTQRRPTPATLTKTNASEPQPMTTTQRIPSNNGDWMTTPRRTGEASRRCRNWRGETTRSRRGEMRWRRSRGETNRRRTGETTRKRGEMTGARARRQGGGGGERCRDGETTRRNTTQRRGETTRPPDTESPHQAEPAGSAPVFYFYNFKLYCMYICTNPRKASPSLGKIYLLYYNMCDELCRMRPTAPSTMMTCFIYRTHHPMYPTAIHPIPLLNSQLNGRLSYY